MGTTAIDPKIQASFLLATINLIKAKLSRVRVYIIDTYQVNGRLQPEEQHALRVIDSRIRELHRSLLIQTRPPEDPDRRMAEAETRMKHRDNGDIFRWRMRNHAFGRIGCNGCEYDYEQGNGLGMPRKEIVSKVCPCGKGVMHSLGIESAQEGLEGIGEFWLGVGLCPEVKVAHRVAQEAQRWVLEGTGAILMVCEACGEWEVKP